LFFNTEQFQRSPLAERLGCEFSARGGIRVDGRQRTCVPGLYVVGDALREVQFVIAAAAQGAVAGVAINHDLQELEGRVLKGRSMTR
jgi:pyruvate/2-oxoglutarate dehydrogenase complex dihydrolipoamide dehydrogenase (E3) component